MAFKCGEFRSPEISGTGDKKAVDSETGDDSRSFRVGTE